MFKSRTRIPVILIVFGLAVSGVWFVVDAGDKSRKKAVETSNAPKAIGPYSQAIVADGFVFAAGQVGIDPKSGELVAGGIEAETEQALRNIEAVLKASDSDLENVVKTTIFLSDISDFAKVNEIYGRVFKAPFPARSTVQAARLPRGAKIEIEVTALERK